MPSHAVDFAVFHHDDQIGVLNGGYALRNDKLRRSGDLLPHRLTDLRVRPRIDRGGRVVQNQHLRLFQQRTRDAEPLLLAAGNVGAALLDVP